MEYTKGEWKLEQLPITKGYQVKCNGELIAAVPCPDDDANARLIAQAPRLYEALKESVKASEDAISALNNLGESCPASIGLAAEHGRQALAKVEGK